MAGIPGLGPEGIINQDFINQQVEATRIEGGASDGGFDRNMFMNILLTQLQNQSPFDTVESEKIMEQQAILTEVEQNVQQTETMEDIMGVLDIGLADIANSLYNINDKIDTIVGNTGGSPDNGDSGEGSDGGGV